MPPSDLGGAGLPICGGRGKTSFEGGREGGDPARDGGWGGGVPPNPARGGGAPLEGAGGGGGSLD